MVVKSIFKWLIGTIVVIAVSLLMVELVNVYLITMQINQLSRIAINKACVLYGQETYKREDIGNVNLPDIVGSSGMVAVSGRIYDYSNAQDIYNALYTNSNDFSNWSSDKLGIWNNLDLILMGIGRHTNLPQTEENVSMSSQYRSQLMTPLNLGIPYIDVNTVNRILKWNLAATFSNGNNALIVDNDGSGRIYVRYNGFRIYVNDASILNVEYEVVNAVDNPNRLRVLANIESSNLGVTDPSDDRAKVCLAGITYSIPIAYEGVTPYRKLIEYLNGNKVAGLHGENQNGSGGTSSISETNLVSGGMNNSNNLPVSSKFIFNLVK